jgi:hypothetical protein
VLTTFLPRSFSGSSCQSEPEPLWKESWTARIALYCTYNLLAQSGLHYRRSAKEPISTSDHFIAIRARPSSTYVGITLLCPWPFCPWPLAPFCLLPFAPLSLSFPRCFCGCFFFVLVVEALLPSLAPSSFLPDASSSETRDQILGAHRTPRTRPPTCDTTLRPPRRHHDRKAPAMISLKTSPYLLVAGVLVSFVLLFSVGSDRTAVTRWSIPQSTSSKNSNLPPNYRSASSNHYNKLDTKSELGRASNATLGVCESSPSTRPVVALSNNSVASSSRSFTC